MKKFMRQNGSQRSSGFVWLALVGQQADREFRIQWPVLPSEEMVRRVLEIPDNEPVLVGRP